MQEDAHKHNAEKEAREALNSSSTIPTEKLKDKGKYFLEGPEKAQPSSTLEILHNVVEFKKGLQKLSLEV